MGNRFLKSRGWKQLPITHYPLPITNYQLPTKMKIIRLDHYNITAPIERLNEIRDFYVNIIGLVEGFRPNFGRAGYWLYADDQPILHLIVPKDNAASSTPQTQTHGYLNHIAFNCKGLPETLNQLKRHQITFQTGQISELETFQIFLKDPAGIRIELNFQGEKLEE